MLKTGSMSMVGVAPNEAVMDCGSMSIVGVEQNEIILDCVGAEAPAQFLCIAEENSLPEIGKVAYAKAKPLQDLCLADTFFLNNILNQESVSDQKGGIFVKIRVFTDRAEKRKSEMLPAKKHL